MTFCVTQLLHKSLSQVHTIYREKEVLAKLDHPFVVSLQYAFQTEAHLCLVIEYVPGGTLRHSVLRGNKTGRSW